MQTLRTNVKNIFFTMLGLMIIFSLIYLSFLNYFDNTDCKNYNYTEKLNGGAKEFNGKKFTIQMCGSGVNNKLFFGDGMDTVQLTIFDDQGEILVKRKYKVFWDGQPGHEPINITKDSIIYHDDENQEEKTIKMPPSYIEWIRAKILFS